MQITPGAQSTAAFTPANSTAAAKAWQVGVLLQATVKAILPGGNVTLRIANTLLTGKPPVPLQQGQMLQLQVIEAGTKPVLKILSNTAGTPHTQQIAEALRVNLPRQTPLPQLLARLAPLAQPQPAAQIQTQAGAGLARPLLEQITQLVNRLAYSGDTFNAAGLRRALSDSGTLLEAKLARAAPQPMQFSADIKAGLLQLRAVLTNAAPGVTAELPAQNEAALPPLRGTPLTPQAPDRTPAGAGLPATPPTTPQLLGLIDAALARIQLSQLASLPVADDKRPTWMFELPLRHGSTIDVLQVRIEAPDPDQHNNNTPQGKTSAWCIELAFDLEQLGAMHARISVNQSRVSVSLWAMRAETVSLFNQQLETLRSNLQHNGLEVDNLVCLPGTPPPASGTGNTSRRLLNVNA